MSLNYHDFLSNLGLLEEKIDLKMLPKRINLDTRIIFTSVFRSKN